MGALFASDLAIEYFPPWAVTPSIPQPSLLSHTEPLLCHPVRVSPHTRAFPRRASAPPVARLPHGMSVSPVPSLEGAPLRQSRRLSGRRPDLSLDEARTRLNSPRRSRRDSGASDFGDERPPVVVPAPLGLEAIPETVAPPITALPPVRRTPVERRAPLRASTHATAPVPLITRPRVIPKGRCQSGRFWKSDRDRFRSVIKSRGLQISLETRVERRADLQRVKAKERALKDERLADIAEQRRRREENQKRKEENQKKSEVYQIIKNPAKIKRMKKKHLKMLVKRDILDKVQAAA